MTNYSAKNVDEFIEAAPLEAHLHLEQIRAAVKTAVPGIEETISYGKPYYKYPKHIVGFDAYKHHVNFEVYSGQLEKAVRAELEAAGYKTGNKSFQIRYDQNVPVGLIKAITKSRIG